MIKRKHILNLRMKIVNSNIRLIHFTCVSECFYYILRLNLKLCLFEFEPLFFGLGLSQTFGKHPELMFPG
jgi:hypothetical protein